MNLKCKTCLGEAGGFCYGCDEPVCLSCSVTVVVDLGFDAYRHRCEVCATVMVLTDPRVEATWRKTA